MDKTDRETSLAAGLFLGHLGALALRPARYRLRDQKIV